MTQIKLKATDTASGRSWEFGPWPRVEDAQYSPVDLAHINDMQKVFAQGWISCLVSLAENPVDPASLTWELLEDPDPGPHAVGVLHAHASASVTHADGSVD